MSPSLGIRKTPLDGASPGQPALGRLDTMTSRDLCQYQPFCDPVFSEGHCCYSTVRARPGSWEWWCSQGAAGQGLADRARPTLAGQWGHLPGNRGGLRPGQGASLWAAVAQQDTWPGTWPWGRGSCSSGRAKARVTAESSSPGLEITPGCGHLTVSRSLSQGHGVEGAALSSTSSELAMSPSTQKPSIPEVRQVSWCTLSWYYNK